MVASVRYYYLFLLIFRRERNHTSLVGLAPSVALSSFGLVAVDDARSRKIFITCTFILIERNCIADDLMDAWEPAPHQCLTEIISDQAPS